ncbi:hypothetical protein KY285_023968 [Solanum tuberosum]|nr:hypothetical protein KY289_025786 [Solanum tuberosum]KAH0676167.1 hypothetical protein KY285_023968 [Solanum tuberosum]
MEYLQPIVDDRETDWISTIRKIKNFNIHNNIDWNFAFPFTSSVVNQASSIKAYELEVVNEIGPSKMLECFIWDPGLISIWLKGRMSLKEGFMHIEENEVVILDRFYGTGSPEGWLYRAEQYFTFLGFDEEYWLPLPSFYLDGEALTWFNWLFHNKLFFYWKHFKDIFSQRFRQQTNREVLGRLDNSLQSSASAYDTGSSQTYHVFDKLQMKYKFVESVELITKNDVEVEPFEEIETPIIGNANSVELNLVHEPSFITEDQVFDEISHTTVSSNIHDLKTIVYEVEHFVTTVDKVYNDNFNKEMKLPLTVLHDTGGSNSDEEENSHDNVALFEKSLSLHTSGLFVVFSCKGTVISNASSRLNEIDYPFADTIWLRTVPCWHDSLEQFHWGDQVEVLLCLDFCVPKCNWVDTGQECNLSIFLLYGICAHMICNSLALSLGSVIFLGWMTGLRTISSSALLHSTLTVIHDEVDSDPLINKSIRISFQGKKIVEALSLDNFFLENEVSIPTSAMHYVDVYLKADNEKSVEEFDGEHKLSPFPFAHAANFLSVTIPIRAVDPCVWDPGIHFEFRALTSYTVYNAKELLLLGCTVKFFLIAYSNSTSRVCDPGQPRCVNSYLSNECLIIVYNCILFTCLSIAYTLVLHEYYYDIKHKVGHPSAGKIYGVLEMVEWAAHQRLPHGLGTTLVFAILLNNCVIAGKFQWRDLVECEFLALFIDASSASISASASVSLGEIFWCIVLLDTSHIIKLPSHVIPKVSKNYATMSRLLQAANQIMMLFLHGFACSSQAHYTSSFQMTFPDSNLEDKVLFGGGCIVVNQASSIKAYKLEVVNEIGPSKMLECFIWDPNPISIWLKGRTSLKGGFMHIEENVCHLLFSSRV